MVNDYTHDVFPWTSRTDRNVFSLSKMKIWEDFINHLRGLGIIAYLWFYSDDSNGLYPAKNSSEEQLYFSYLISRFAAFENIIWNLALEYQEYRDKAWAQSMGAFVKAEDPSDHLVAVHQLPGNTWTLSGDPNIDIFSHQGTLNSAKDVKNLVLTVQQKSVNDGHAVVIWPEEFHFDPVSSERATIREIIWGSVMQQSGYTLMGSYFWGAGDTGTRWYHDLDKTVSDLLQRVDRYELMSERNSLVTDGGNTKFCMADPGKEYLVFSTSTGNLTINLSLAPGTYTVEWWNTDNGSVTSGSPIDGGNSRTLSVPFEDAVLYLKREGPMDQTPPSVPTFLAGSAAGQEVTLSWTAATDTESGIIGYRIYRGTTAGSQAFLGAIGNVTTFTDHAPLPGTTYYYKVSAVNGIGLEGAKSNITTVTTEAGNIPPSGDNISTTIHEDAVAAITLSATDVEGDTANKYRIESNPKNGTISGFNNSSGDLIYTPEKDANGTDTLTFSASDNNGATFGEQGSVIITITPINDPPVIPDTAFTTAMEKQIGIQLRFDDPDGPGPFAYEITAYPEHGELIGGSNDRDYLPNPGFIGVDSFSWHTHDGIAWSAVMTWLITVTDTLNLSVSLVAYLGSATVPIIVAEGFIEGAAQCNDRTGPPAYTNVPAELSGLTYLLTARDDRSTIPAENEVLYRVNASAACTVFVLFDNDAGIPSWISSDGWTNTELSVTASGNAYSIYKKYFPAGDIDLKRQVSGSSEGTGYVFKAAGGGTVEVFSDASPSGQSLQIRACPNPFNPEIAILVPGWKSLGNAGRIRIFDVDSRLVADLSARIINGRATWNASNVPSGVYFVRLTCGKTVISRKVSLIR